jgi:hypothetical protein
VGAVEQMIAGARRDGVIRDDIDPTVLTTLIGQTAYAVARSQPASQELVDAYITVLMDGLKRTT